ncbi:thiamine pyrophosphate-dependent enzyme [Pengzhenrongella frigida]|uniref:thiamine pyrophosphate-dependent enzyme n=1 Tax=Pengzhenrongella frigida TaxID=1259133 RepID=UPI001F5D54C3|nr:thiamine pyrophosphate-dependent enzyme [Cellulomonas sp. HLT2-17]
MLRAGRRPAVLVGQGAYGAAAEVLDVVDRLGAGIATSLLGKPILDESLPFHCGVMGHLGTTAAADLLAACDTLLIIGSSDPWTEFYPPVGQARTVQIDLAARNLGAKYPVEVGLAGDTAETLRALAPMFTAAPVPGPAPAPGREWRSQVEGMVASWHDVLDSRVHTTAELLNPQLVVHELSAHLPAGTQVAVDVGSVTYWYARFLRLGPDMPAHLSSTLASMGSAMPYGLAAKLYRPDRPVVALAGDGSMQMNGLSELITVAARWRQWADPRFVVLVLHNGDLAEVSWEQREVEGDPRSARSLAVPTFPYAGYAELLGLRGLRIGAAREVGPAWRAAFASDRPCLVEAVVDPDVPLLPPRQAEDDVTQTIRALRLEGNVTAAVQLRQQRRQEAHHPAAGRPGGP